MFKDLKLNLPQKPKQPPKNWPKKIKVTVQARRIHCRTEEETLVDVTFEERWSPSLKEWWLSIIKGGATGYESISIKNLFERDDDRRDWCACAGTKGRWDTLIIPASEVWKLQQALLPEYILRESKEL